jgi:lipopolysaccharide/colanic/teichoic acid biosynthesis glycosyltransferase
MTENLFNNNGLNKSICSYDKPLPDLVKKISDIIAAVLFLIILSPLILILSVLIIITDNGQVIYKQDRVGKDGRPFSIYKFRSMKNDPEHSTHLLAGMNKERMTWLGKFMRPYRIDEIPNFLNVIKGEMSIVGPRPERKYFIDQIVKKAPQYLTLQKVKPGITSWGQVRFGYASNVDEMVERLKYDLYYMRHRSLWFDLKIILYTFGTVLKGKGL